MVKKDYNFGEKKTEKIYDKETKSMKEFEVWQSPKYLESKAKAIELIDGGKYGLKESDFWILMNTTKSGKMAYTGLIISHNGCLKINDALEDKLKFKPSSLKRELNPYNNSLIYEYANDEQGVFEVGEVSAKNCGNDYPFAMALKRCFDRVVLKISKVAYAGIYSDSEADEFINPYNAADEEQQVKPKTAKTNTKEKVAKSGAKVIETAEDAKKVNYLEYKFLSGKHEGKKIAEVYEIDAKYLNDILEAKQVSTALKEIIQAFIDSLEA